MKKRLVKIGIMETGPRNSITDVDGVCVGHFTIHDGGINTGVTAIMPHKGNLFRDKVVAASYVFNGFGKSAGLIQIDELGHIESPILLTNTLSVGSVVDASVRYSLDKNEEIGITTGTVNSVVLECNDSRLNNIRKMVITKDDVFQAINNASSDYEDGSVGAGSGMICHGLKGGIGSSSRVFNINNEKFTLGVLVNTNFGHSSGKDLVFNGRHIGKDIEMIKNTEEDKGSIIVVIATDVPLDTNSLKRVVKRASIGIGKTGSYVGHGSGDIFVGFSTGNIVKHFNDNPFNNFKILNEDYINILFRAVVEATEEAILNSMLYSDKLKGYIKTVDSINDYKDLFEDLLIKNE